MDLKMILEAILFGSPEPMPLEKLAKIVNEPVEKVEANLKELKKELEENQRGIRILDNNNCWLMVSAPSASEYLLKIRKEQIEGELSPTALETLAIIAYQGPVTRAEINEIRGVDSTYSLVNLLSRGLIERKTHPQRTNTFLYSISEKFLRHLGLTSMEQLPDYNSIKEKQKNLRNDSGKF